MRPIFLVGYMGSGKSTLGRKLAEELGLGFIDTDVFLENRFRERVVDMFSSVGEEAFRRRERYITEELSGMDDHVIATGGGLPCYHDNMSLLLTSGTVIYLSGSDETLHARLELCKRTRPTIKDKAGDELLAYIREVLSARRPIYEQAHITASIDGVLDDEGEQRLARRLASHIRRGGTKGEVAEEV